jgi:hypothetical protein
VSGAPVSGSGIVLAALFTAAAATGCSGASEAGGSPVRSPAAARAGGATAALPVPADVHAYLGQAVERTMAVRPRHVSSSTTLAGPRGRHVQTVDGHQGGQPASYQMVIVTDGVRAETRVIGADAWLDARSAQITKAMPAGKTWLRLDTARLAAAGIPTTDDQLAMLYALRATDTERDRGTEITAGVPTRHFTARVDLDRAVCAAPPRSRSDVRQLLTPRSGAAPSFAADVWVDAFQLVRRLRLAADLGGGASTTYELLLPGDNSTAAVVRPPATAAVPLDDVPSLRPAFPARAAAPPPC